MKKCIITVVGQDQIGIMAGVCTYLSEKKINILNITQSIVDGYFNMMMIVDMASVTEDLVVLIKELEELGKSLGVSIHCQREEIFEKMHRL